MACQLRSKLAGYISGDSRAVSVFDVHDSRALAIPANPQVDIRATATNIPAGTRIGEDEGIGGLAERAAFKTRYRQTSAPGLQHVCTLRMLAPNLEGKRRTVCDSARGLQLQRSTSIGAAGLLDAAGAHIEGQRGPCAPQVVSHICGLLVVIILIRIARPDSTVRGVEGEGAGAGQRVQDSQRRVVLLCVEQALFMVCPAIAARSHYRPVMQDLQRQVGPVCQVVDVFEVVGCRRLKQILARLTESVVHGPGEPVFHQLKLGRAADIPQQIAVVGSVAIGCVGQFPPPTSPENRRVSCCRENRRPALVMVSLRSPMRGTLDVVRNTDTDVKSCLYFCSLDDNGCCQQQSQHRNPTKAPARLHMIHMLPDRSSSGLFRAAPGSARVARILRCRHG